MIDFVRTGKGMVMELEIAFREFYEYENIQNELNRMTETQLESDYAHNLMDRAAVIRAEWNK